MGDLHQRHAQAMSSSTVTLRGVSWGHSRGMLPLLATAMALQDQDQGLRVQWDVRSLQHFADQSVVQLADRYDLLVIDHPSVGEAAATEAFLPLDEWLPADTLAELARHSVGVSHWSYQYPDAQGRSRQWALALDAATPVSAWLHGHASPALDWAELPHAAQAGQLALAAWPLDMLMHFYGLCESYGEAPFLREGEMAAPEAALPALAALRRVSDAAGPAALTLNPIAALRALITPGGSEGPTICPMAYGYSNYARRPLPDQRRLQFGAAPRLEGRPWRSTLGGAGIAVSARSPCREAAVRHAAWLASAAVQTGLYTEAGGQPAHRQAWTDELNNRLTDGYFEATLPTLDEAYLRPRYPGYIEFQSEGTRIMAAYLRHELSASQALEALNQADAQHRGAWINHADADLHALARRQRLPLKGQA